MLLLGNCLDKLKELDEFSVDAIVTDPPYFLVSDNGNGFMGKEWDGIIGLWKYLWMDESFVRIAKKVLQSCKVDLSTEGEFIAQENVNMLGLEREKKYPVPRVGNLSKLITTQKKDSVHLIAITREDLLESLKGLFPNHIKESLLPIGEKKNALYVFPSLLPEIESKNYVVKNVIKSFKALECQEKTTTFTQTEIQKIKNVIEAMDGNLFENESTLEIGGIVDTVGNTVEEKKYNVITYFPTDKAEIIKQITWLLYATLVTPESNRIQQSLIRNFFRVIFQEVYRVLKPGGHLLAFAGSRTYQYLTSGVEDAGFEVRDMIEWVYGSGFPKSLNIGKAVDKLQGNKREVTRIRTDGNKGGGANTYDDDNYVWDKPFEETKGISEWEGWGTALKPSHESIMVAQKPFDSSSDIDYTVSICQTLFAQIVKKSSELNLSEKAQQGIVQWNAEKNINTLEDLSEVMDMLQSESEKNLSLNIVLLWLNILGEIWGAMSMFTTETKGSLIIELKILKSLEWENIFHSITLVKNNKIDGLSVDVLNVENLLNAVKLKLSYILTHSVQDNAILQAKKIDFAPKHEPICMARKPLEKGLTVAENCLKWGTGGINIDNSRVDLNGTPKTSGGCKGTDSKRVAYAVENPVKEDNSTGRFPANLIHDNSEEVRECFPETVSKWGKQGGTQPDSMFFGKHKDGVAKESENYIGDSGNASRFFKSIIYTSKASKRDRGEGNNHPTVKPVKLMEYLINMVTREGQTVLDPFMGSGTTGVACKKLNRNFIGIEMNEEYLKIAEARMK